MNFFKLRTSETSPYGRILIVFKGKNRWNELLLKTLGSRFEVWYTYCGDHVKAFGIEDVLSRLRAEIDAQAILAAIVDQEFFSLFHGGALRELSKSTKVGLIFFDDCHNHYMNRQNSCFADFVIVGPDPIERIQYESYGITALNWTLENELVIPESCITAIGSTRTTDLFFAGYNHKPGRREFIEAARDSGLTFLCHETERHGSVSYEDLYKNMCSAKIVLNFSKADNAGSAAYALGYREPVIYQFKGRIIEAGLCGACCISENFPTIGIAGLSEAVPTFENPSEMVVLARKLLASGDWERLAGNLRQVVNRLYSAESTLEKLDRVLRATKTAIDRRIILGADSNYAMNVANRIKTFGYKDEVIRERDWRFFLKSLENIKYSGINYRSGDKCYPFNI